MDGDFVPKPGSLEFGVSILHFGLRAFEAICHMGYGQDVKKFGVKLTQEEKNTKVARERKVKAEFREKLGLIVDQRRDGGAGNTTTGNVARKAFANSGYYSFCLFTKRFFQLNQTFKQIKRSKFLWLNQKLGLMSQKMQDWLTK